MALRLCGKSYTQQTREKLSQDYDTDNFLHIANNEPQGHLKQYFNSGFVTENIDSILSMGKTAQAANKEYALKQKFVSRWAWLVLEKPGREGKKKERTPTPLNANYVMRRLLPKSVRYSQEAGCGTNPRKGCPVQRRQGRKMTGGDRDRLARRGLKRPPERKGPRWAEKRGQVWSGCTISSRKPSLLREIQQFLKGCREGSATTRFRGTEPRPPLRHGGAGGRLTKGHSPSFVAAKAPLDGTSVIPAPRGSSLTPG